jgi:hypothetical protein
VALKVHGMATMGKVFIPGYIIVAALAAEDHSVYLLTQLSGFRKREMNHPLARCELAARAPNISAGHLV